MNDDYDSQYEPETNTRDGDGTTYKDYARKKRRAGAGSDLMTAFNVVLQERTVFPLAAQPIDGNTRLFTYALQPVVGVIIGLVMMIWVNISRIMTMSLFLTCLIGLVLVYAVQAGLPLSGFGQAADALFSGRRRDDQLRILTVRALRQPALFAALLLAALELSAFYFLFVSHLTSAWRALFAMLAVFVLARALTALLTLSLPPLEPEEDGDMKTLKSVQLILYIVIAAAALGLILTGMWAAFASLALMALVAIICHSHFKARFHGITRKLSVFMAASCEVVGLLALLLPFGTFLW